MIKKTKIALVFSILFLFFQTLNAKNQETLLQSKEQELLKTADSMELVDIISMYETPRIVPENDTAFTKTLNASQIEKVKKYLPITQKIDLQPRTESCRYQPGLNLKIFKNKKQVLNLLICFNCDLWALANPEANASSASAKEIVAYGDLKPFRKEFLEIAKEIYPQKFKDVK